MAKRFAVVVTHENESRFCGWNHGITNTWVMPVLDYTYRDEKEADTLLAHVNGSHPNASYSVKEVDVTELLRLRLSQLQINIRHILTELEEN